jgi:hypothetical protein
MCYNCIKYCHFFYLIRNTFSPNIPHVTQRFESGLAQSAKHKSTVSKAFSKRPDEGASYKAFAFSIFLSRYYRSRVSNTVKILFSLSPPPPHPPIFSQAFTKLKDDARRPDAWPIRRSFRTEILSRQWMCCSDPSRNLSDFGVEDKKYKQFCFTWPVLARWQERSRGT